jgi:hypothetical protein
MPFWIYWYILRTKPKIKLCGKEMLMTKSMLLNSMIWCDNANLLYLEVWWNLGWFIFENKTKQVPQWSYYLPKPYVDINAQNLLHMLACDPLSFAKLLWPFVTPRFLISVISTNGRISRVKPADTGKTSVNLGHHLENRDDNPYWPPWPSQHTLVVNPWSKTRSNAA